MPSAYRLGQEGRGQEGRGQEGRGLQTDKKVGTPGNVGNVVTMTTHAHVVSLVSIGTHTV